MTIEGVIHCLPELFKLIEIKKRSEQRKVILRCQSCVIYAISEICRNILNGNIPISEKDKKILSKHKRSLRSLSKKSITLHERRKTVNQVCPSCTFNCCNYSFRFNYSK